MLAGLQDLDSLKVRFADSAEGRLAGMPVHRSAGSIQAYVALMPETEGGDEAAVEVQNGQADGASAVFQTEPSVWATYPNLNPRMYVPVTSFLDADGTRADNKPSRLTAITSTTSRQSSFRPSLGPGRASG